jgi:uncharacterized repeat protein (TIGR03843 family)
LPTGKRFPTNVTVTEQILEPLHEGEISIEGRLIEATNATFYGRVVAEDNEPIECIYKPVRGERPLWDFPDGSLAGREVAAHAISRASGWDIVPPTVLRDGPFGPGMCQAWIEIDDCELVDVVPYSATPDGFLHILDAEDRRGQAVSLVHADRVDLQRMALFDVIVNNADRKGGHVLSTPSHVYGVDHGVCFHVEHKLRTVLWGWAGEPIPDPLLAELEALRTLLATDRQQVELAALIRPDEIEAAGRRLGRLLRTGEFPAPPAGGWPAIPWPAM